MTTISPGEIVYARITVSTIKRKGRPAKTLTAAPFVFAASWEGYTQHLSYTSREDRMTINKFGVSEDLTITDLQVISRHGFKAKPIIQS